MKTRVLLSIGLVSAFLVYKNFPKYYFSAEPSCVASFSDLQGNAYEQAIWSHLKDKTPSDFRYFFRTFTQEDGKNYMIVNMRNETHCFDVKVRVAQGGKLEGMKRTNGVSYPKELYDLQWKLEQRAGRREVVFKNMGAIID